MDKRKRPQKVQKKDLENVSGRDLFQTPNYATDILLPFLYEAQPMIPFENVVVWEPAAGLGKIARRIREMIGYQVIETDLQTGQNFLTIEPDFHFDFIVTNPAFSIAEEFLDRCISFGKPFALLLPAVYNQWVIRALRLRAEKIIPDRRIDYITPNILQRIHEGELWEDRLKEYHQYYKNVKEFIFHQRTLWDAIEGNSQNCDYCLYKDIYSAPSHLLRKYSSSYFHSMWLTMGLNIGRQETFVTLRNEDKENI